jgi:predicted metal-dependent HD superfamily phosphohydrolase
MEADELEVRVAWERHVSDDATEWLDQVLRRHREPHRHHHGVRHVAWMLRHLADLDAAGHVADPSAAVAAACFHDAVYEPTAPPGHNERASAALAEQALTEIGWPSDRVRRVSDMILATAEHDTAAASGDTRAVLAADLAVLAAEPNRYEDYVRAVRKEYGHLDEPAWRRGRAAVLRDLLARDELFGSELGLGRWERRARANMTAELAGLER